jgi:hypothetical protein
MGLSFKGPLLAPIPEGTEGKSFDELVESLGGSDSNDIAEVL